MIFHTGTPLFAKIVIVGLILLFEWYVIQGWKWMPSTAEYFMRTKEEKIRYRKRLHLLAALAAWVLAVIIL